MKKMFSILLALLFMLPVYAENVVQMPYTVITPDYVREGLYTGEWQNNQPEGYGVFTTATSSGLPWHYIGYWANGLMDGEGGTYWDDGALEVGTYALSYFIDGYALDGASTVQTAIVQPTATPTATSKISYIGNKNSKVFHYPSCDSVSKMKDKNKVSLSSRQEAIKKGYKPCARCNP